jgi:hypothetical protein
VSVSTCGGLIHGGGLYSRGLIVRGLRYDVITTNNRYGQIRCLEAWHINMSNQCSKIEVHLSKFVFPT